MTWAARPAPRSRSRSSQAEPHGSAPAEQQDVVTRYDTDGDGEISLAEYNAALPDLGATLTVADLIKLRAANVASSR